MRVILEMEDFVAAFRTGTKQAKVHGACKNRILNLQADQKCLMENMYLSRLLGTPQAVTVKIEYSLQI